MHTCCLSQFSWVGGLFGIILPINIVVLLTTASGRAAASNLEIAQVLNNAAMSIALVTGAMGVLLLIAAILGLSYVKTCESGTCVSS